MDYANFTRKNIRFPQKFCQAPAGTFLLPLRLLSSLLLAIFLIFNNLLNAWENLVNNVLTSLLFPLFPTARHPLPLGFAVLKGNCIQRRDEGFFVSIPFFLVSKFRGRKLGFSTQQTQTRQRRRPVKHEKRNIEYTS